MKNRLLILVCIALLTNCKEQTSKVETTITNVSKTETKKPEGKVEDFDCESFFEKGDYAALCFTDSKLPESINGPCIFDFVTKGNKQVESLKVQFAGKSSSMLAENSFRLKKGRYSKGKTSDIPNLGNEAFFDVYSTDLKSLSRSHKDLHVRFKNITFVIMAEYMTNKKTSCFFSNEEMIAFAQTIIKNMQ